MKRLLFLTVLCASYLYAFQTKENPLLLVLNKGAASLTVLNANSMEVIKTIPVGAYPHEVVVSEDGKIAYAANYGAQTPGHTISVIDLESLKEIKRVDVKPFYRPHGVQVIGDNLYFTAETNRAIARLNTKTYEVDWVMGTGQGGSHMLVGNSAQTRFYTANIPDNTVTMFELNSVPPAPSKIFQVKVGQQPEAIDLSPDGKEIWTGLNQDKAIDIVDTQSKKVVGRVNTSERPYRVRFAPDGKRVYSTVFATREIVVTDASSRKEIKRMKFDSAPLGITFSKDSKLAFVTAVQEDVVYKIDLVNFTVVGTGKTGIGPDGVAVSGL